jgi:hypothetical protein
MMDTRSQSACTRPRVSLPPEEVVDIRQKYAANVVVKNICAQHLISRWRVYRCLDRACDADGNPLPQIPRRRSGVRRHRKLNGDPAGLIARLRRTADGQLRELEDRLARRAQEPGERERDARVMALLSRALKDLVAIEKLEKGAPERGAAKDEEADVRDVDAFRRDLVRQMDAIIARRADGGCGQPDAC